MSNSAIVRAKLRAQLEPAARALMKVWYLKTMAARLEERTPVDLPQYRWYGAAHRVLLIGNGPTHGWGVLTHGYSLTGQLGAELYSASNKPVNVDYVGDEMMNVRTAKDWIADVDIAAYDAIIVLMGWNDAARMTPKAVWAEHIGAFFDEIRARKSKHAGIMAVGIESMSPETGYSGLIAKLGNQHAAKLNQVLKEQMQSEREVFLQLEERVIDSQRRFGAPITYRFWAEQIAQAACPLLPDYEPSEALDRDTQNFSWIGAARALGRDNHGVPTHAFAELEEKARRTFGTKLAQVTVLDSGRQWFPNHLGPAPSSTPRQLTYCHVTAQQEDGMLIVPNANKDERFKGSPYLEQISMPFYAGKALVDREGNVIGSFCVLDVVPRPKWLTVNRRKLEHFAAQAQEELWRIEDQVRAELAKQSNWNPNFIEFSI